MARSGAVAGLCPITEANLGDGTFPAPLFLEEGGRYGIGSDSNVLISLPDELRQLEYSQRLALRARNVIATPGGSTARALFDQAIVGGGAALKAPAGLASGQLRRHRFAGCERRAISCGRSAAGSLGVRRRRDASTASGRSGASGSRRVAMSAVKRSSDASAMR